MKNILTLLVLCLMVGTASAQIAGSQGTVTPPNAERYTAQALQRNSILEPFDNKNAWESKLSVTVADVITNGIIDTAIAAKYTLYGKVWATSQAESFPRVYIGGVDSADIIVSRRWVNFTAQTAAFGPWTVVGSMSIKLPRGSRDTLRKVLSPTFTDTTFKNDESGYIQYKYEVTPTNAKVTGGANRPQNTKQRTFTTWRGEATLTFRRAGGR